MTDVVDESNPPSHCFRRGRRAAPSARTDRPLDGAGQAELQTPRNQVELQNELGVRSELLAAEDLSERWPILAELGFAGGSYCAADGYLNQHRALRGIALAAEAAGARIECGVEVIGLDVEADAIGAVRTTNGILRTDLVVNCAGAWAPHLAQQIGVALPIRSRRVQLLHAHPSIALPRDLPWLIGPGGQVHVRQDTAGRIERTGF